MNIILDESLVSTFVREVKKDSSRIAAFHAEQGNHETGHAVAIAAEATNSL